MGAIHTKLSALLVGAVLLGAPTGLLAAGESARVAYTAALGHERTVRQAASNPTLPQIRKAIERYERVVRRFPGSGYSDNALWQGANLALLAYERFGQPADRRTGLRLLTQLKKQFPTSSLIARSGEIRRQFEHAAPPPPPPPARPVSSRSGTGAGGAPSSIAALRRITRTELPDGVRVTIELDAETPYKADRLDNPRRVFFDLKHARPVAALQDAALTFADDVVKEIRLGRHPHDTTRVVVDMEGMDRYSVFTLYEPFRLVIDFQRPDASAVATAGLRPAADRGPLTASTAGASAPAPSRPPVDTPPLVEVPTALVPPALPSANSDGQFSLARQLGLGVSRVVIDAGHGGHDPGARANGLSEAELVLDVAQRLARLLDKKPGVEVVMTRDRDLFIPLEERTAIANRVGADLFLSIHANAARNSRARGVETYFLNFAPNAEAEAIAARENAGSTRTMHKLPEIVKAIALNNKINESRDFAAMVQRSMVRGLSARNRDVRDLGVKQAPFVVLIGAGMPSVLAEISFVTHKQEAQLLKTGAYRQEIAEALMEAVLKYQQSLKKPRAVASTR